MKKTSIAKLALIMSTLSFPLMAKATICDGGLFYFVNDTGYNITNISAQKTDDFVDLFTSVGPTSTKSASVNTSNVGEELNGNVTFDITDSSGTEVAKGQVSYRYVWGLATCHTYSDDPGYGVPAPVLSPPDGSTTIPNISIEPSSKNGRFDDASVTYKFVNN